MTNTLRTSDTAGGTVPVTVDSTVGGLGVLRFDLSRGEIEGLQGALVGTAYLDTSEISLTPGEEYLVSVKVTVFTANQEVPMREYDDQVTKVERIAAPWYFGAPTAGTGPVQRVHIETVLEVSP